VGRRSDADRWPSSQLETGVLSEHSTRTRLRVTEDGSVHLQRDVPERDGGEPGTDLLIDGGRGDIRIRAGDAVVVDVTTNGDIRINCAGTPIVVAGGRLEVSCAGGMTVEGDVDINGALKVSGASGSTTIRGHEITGA
jgi:hypothetical protein